MSALATEYVPLAVVLVRDAQHATALVLIVTNVIVLANSALRAAHPANVHRVKVLVYTAQTVKDPENVQLAMEQPIVRNAMVLEKRSVTYVMV